MVNPLDAGTVRQTPPTQKMPALCLP